jgi:hypothetical protein
MDREVNGKDTGKIELENIINCLKENHYVFEDLEEAHMEGSMVANFEKNIKYSDKDGNYINDRFIKIKIEFDSDFDYKNDYTDRNGDFVFNRDKGIEFIEKLFYGAYDTSGGSRKRIIKRKKTTRRNRKTKIHFS